jgi:hypothetical protein
MNNQDVQLVTLCMGTIIPAIVGLITSTRASVPFQTALGAVMSVIVGIVSEWAAVGSFNWIAAGGVYRKTGIQKIQGVTDGIALDRVIGPSVQSTP